MTKSVTEMQGVYDLIIATCQHDPEFKAWGASALRFLNKIEAAIADTHAKRGDDFSAPSLMSGGGADRQSPTPDPLSNTHPNKGEES